VDDLADAVRAGRHEAARRNDDRAAVPQRASAVTSRVLPSENVTVIVNWHASPGRLSLAEHVMAADAGDCAGSRRGGCRGRSRTAQSGLFLSSHATPATTAASTSTTRMMLTPAILLHMVEPPLRLTTSDSRRADRDSPREFQPVIRGAALDDGRAAEHHAPVERRDDARSLNVAAACDEVQRRGADLLDEA